MLYNPGDIVKVKNARNGLGIYEIIEYIETSHRCYYRVYVLDIDRETLPYINEERTWRMRPTQFLRKAQKKPELYRELRFRRYNLTTKDRFNVVRKLPIERDQIVA